MVDLCLVVDYELSIHSLLNFCFSPQRLRSYKSYNFKTSCNLKNICNNKELIITYILYNY